MNPRWKRFAAVLEEVVSVPDGRPAFGKDPPSSPPEAVRRGRNGFDPRRFGSAATERNLLQLSGSVGDRRAIFSEDLDSSPLIPNLWGRRQISGDRARFFGYEGLSSGPSPLLQEKWRFAGGLGALQQKLANFPRICLLLWGSLRILRGVIVFPRKQSTCPGRRDLGGKTGLFSQVGSRFSGKASTSHAIRQLALQTPSFSCNSPACTARGELLLQEADLPRKRPSSPARRRLPAQAAIFSGSGREVEGRGTASPLRLSTAQRQEAEGVEPAKIATRSGWDPGSFALITPLQYQ
jgi:hypothetical protein